MNDRYKSLLGAVAMLFGFSGIANSAIVITAVESGGHVVFSTDGGTLDLTGLTYLQPVSAQVNNLVSPATGAIQINASDPTGGLADFDVYTGVTGPASFGSGSARSTTVASGSGFLILNGSLGRISLESGFVSGDTVEAASQTHNWESFASLGLDTGVYTWSWAGDSVTLNVVPIPAAVWLFGSALGWLGWMRRKQSA
jgi:hypothetical protein